MSIKGFLLYTIDMNAFLHPSVGILRNLKRKGKPKSRCILSLAALFLGGVFPWLGIKLPLDTMSTLLL